MPMVFITFVILYFILKRFFFEKLRNFMEARERKIQDAFDNAAAANKNAETRLMDYDKKLSGAEAERREILLKAKADADASARDIIRAAEEKAAAMRISAEREIERERQQAISEMREQIASLAVFAASKILEREIGEGDQQAIIDKAIAEAGQSEWKI
jgi:F-type H+-transporting ATPase subunit b